MEIISKDCDFFLPGKNDHIEGRLILTEINNHIAIDAEYPDLRKYLQYFYRGERVDINSNKGKFFYIINGQNKIIDDSESEVSKPFYFTLYHNYLYFINRVQSRILFIGKKFDSPNDILFKKIEIFIPGLYYWLQSEDLEKINLINHGNYMKDKYSNILFKVYEQGLNIPILSDSSINSSCGSITIEFNQPVTYEEIGNNIQEVLYFFCLLKSKKIDPIFVRGIMDDGSLIEVFDDNFGISIGKEEPTDKPFLINCSFVREPLCGLMFKWLNDSKKYRASRRAYFSSIYNQKANLEQIFVTLSSSVEAFHRANDKIKNKKDFNDDEYRIIKKHKKTFIDNVTREVFQGDSNKRDLLCGKLASINMRNASNQLLDILELNEEICCFFDFLKGERKEEFINDVHSLRNAFAHSNDEKLKKLEENAKKMNISISDILLHYVYWIDQILWMCFLIETGFAPNEVSHIIGESWKFHTFNLGWNNIKEVTKS